VKLPLKPLLVILGIAATVYAAVLLLTGDAPLATIAQVLLTPAGWGAVLLCCVNYLLRGIRWRYWMQHYGRPLPWAQGLRFYLSGYTFTPTPANVGEAVRGLMVRPALSPVDSLAIYGAERIADLLALLLLTLPLLAWATPALQMLRGSALAPLLTPTALTLVIAAVSLTGVLMCGLLWLKRQQVMQRLPWLRTAAACLVVQPQRWTLLTLLAWLAQGLATWLICREMGVALHPLLATAIYALAMVGGALSMLPAGLGGTEALLTGLLVLYGAPLPVALAATILIRLLTLWLAVGVGALALLYSAAFRRDLSLR
jgi:uncharacterized membrane protein YbhN (UPF0104 family)